MPYFGCSQCSRNLKNIDFLWKNAAELLLALIVFFFFYDNKKYEGKKSYDKKNFNCKSSIFLFSLVSKQMLEIQIQLKITATLVTENVRVTGGYRDRKEQSAEKEHADRERTYLSNIVRSGRRLKEEDK